MLAAMDCLQRFHRMQLFFPTTRPQEGEGQVYERSSLTGLVPDRDSASRDTFFAVMSRLLHALVALIGVAAGSSATPEEIHSGRPGQVVEVGGCFS